MQGGRGVVALFSGGLDSTVLLSKFLADGFDVVALSVNYGQRHAKELQAASKVCSYLGVERLEVNLGFPWLFGSNALTSHEQEVPEGHYEEESMKQTVVPNRNMVLVALAGALAMSKRFGYVAYAAHGGDHAIYPDCRREFFEPLGEALRAADWNEVSLLAPFDGMSKADVVKLGDRIGAPIHMSWSCYKGCEKHCGRCGTCTERIEAFQLAGVTDKTGYE